LKSIATILRLTSLLLIAGIFPSGLWSRPTDPQAPPNEISLQEYVTELRIASAALGGESPATIHAYRLSFPSEWIVLTDGQAMSVKTDWLASALLAQENSPKVASDRVRQG